MKSKEDTTKQRVSNVNVMFHSPNQPFEALHSFFSNYTFLILHLNDDFIVNIKIMIK